MFFDAPGRPARSLAASVAALVFLVAGAYSFQVRETRFIYIDSSSMEPTLRPGDYLVRARPPEYRRGDLVTFLSPRDGGLTTKRLVALGGDRVEVAKGRLLLNGREFDEPYIKESETVYALEPVGVPEGHVFLLGDNRNNSEDSSVWGPVPADLLLGRVCYRYRPLGRLGRL